MKSCWLICALMTLCGADINNHQFPSNFKFGASTAAYQIEGGWNEDGKGTSMWDDYTHNNPSVTKDQLNGDIACDSYHLYREDVALLKELGAQFYRFSISWPRILPNGTINVINQKGIDYYTALLKLLKENSIEPIVTLYHWDLPTILQEIGGWTNPDIAQYYGDYARLCFQYFGPYVKYWVTFNEALATCAGYDGTAALAPGYTLSAEGTYLCAYTQVKAHALAYHIYQDEFKEKYGGKLSMAFVSQYMRPESSSEDAYEVHDLAMQFALGLYANPIYRGNWPEKVIERVNYRSQRQGLAISRLPEFTQEEIDYIYGTYDWFGVNYYTTYYAQLKYTVDDLPANASYEIDRGYTTFTDPSWKSSTSSTWLKQVPEGLVELLKWVHDNYNQPEIIITENGWSEDGSSLNDTDRIEYVQLHLSKVLDAIYDYGINVTGYTQWSLLDNFEWLDGYTSKFGIVKVDFDSSNRTRTPKQSFYWYKNVIQSRCLVDECSVSVAVAHTALWKLLLPVTVINCFLISKLFYTFM